ncbi:MFS transporter permease [Methanocella sp. CWC-04]|uniref:MFS transporter permease n=1 Tax=Methanooceanicella nereidis TaxID=2052831 RepID=A0AAP2W6R1_9EURY|nr:MFS transporter [Methanocella sp. CWC-04]MCD1295603.1 MFS transporter permease [Methanocella sp. CWC-04]
MEVKKQQLLVLLFSMFIFTLGFGIIIPVMPYYSKNLGATAFDLGLLMASYSLMQFLFAPSWGKLSDRIGRKPVLALGLLGFGVSFVIFGVSDSLWMLLAARIFGGMMSAGIYPSSLAIIADVTGPKDRGKAMGWMGAASGLGMIFGPAISGVISVWGLSAPFFAAGGLAILTMAISYAILPESGKKMSSENMNKKISLVSPLKTAVGIFFILTLTISLVMACFQGTIAYFSMDRFNLSDDVSYIPLMNGPDQGVNVSGPAVMAIICTVMGIFGVICQGFLVNKAIDRLGEEKTVMIGFIISTISLVMTVTTFGLISLLAYSSLFSIGSGLVMPCLNSIISGRTDQNRQGAIMGVLGSYNSLGRIIGPPVGGFIYDINMILPYILSAVISAMGAAAVVRSIKKDGREKTTIQPEIRI